MSSHLSPSLPFRGPTVGERPLASLGLGLALLFGVPGVAVLLVITVVGLVLGLILLFAYPVLLMAGFFAGLLFAGDALFRLVRRQHEYRSRLLLLLVFVATLAVVWLLRFIPVLGNAVGFILMLSGLGAIGLRTRPRSQLP